MPRDRRIIAPFPNRHNHIRHLRKRTDPPAREPSRHGRRAIILVPVLYIQPRSIEQQAITTGRGVVDKDIRIEPVSEERPVCFRLRQGGVGVAVAEGPADEGSGVHEGFTAVVDGAVGGVEGVADEADLLFGDEDGVGDVEEGGQRRRGGRGFGGGPGSGQVESRGFGAEEGFELAEKGESDGGDVVGCGRGEVEGLDGFWVGGIEWEVGVEGGAGG